MSSSPGGGNSEGWLNQSEPLIGDGEKRALIEYIESGGWLTEYQKTREFEATIAEFVGSAHCVALSNGTVSLVAALLALGIGPGDEVIVPDFTMIASANAVVLAGAVPRLVDIDRTNLCLDVELAGRAVTPRTKAMMVVTLNGRSPDMDRAAELADRHGLHIIEDAAQSLGSKYRGTHLGTFGRVGSFSFSVPKVITTGQGGALVTDDPALAERIRGIKDFGRPSAGTDVHEMIGFNFKFTDLQAVIGLEQMKTLQWRIERKKEIFSLYRRELEGSSGVRFIDTNLEDTAPWFVDVLVPDPEGLGAYLRTRNIGTRRFYPAIHSQPAYGWRGEYPNSAYAFDHGLWLPSSLRLTDDDIKRVCREIRACIESGPREVLLR